MINLCIVIFIIIIHHLVDTALYKEETDFEQNIEYSFYYSIVWLVIGIFLPFHDRLGFVWFASITFVSTIIITEYTKLHFLCILQLLLTYFLLT